MFDLLKRFYKLSFSVLVLTLAWSVLRGSSAPSPAQDLLVIYTADNAYQVSLMQAFTTALGAISPAPSITLVNATGTSGFYGALQAQTGKSNLYAWCQVYDLRFRDDKAQQINAVQDDIITSTGPNNDAQLFSDYLAIGGNIFFQGEQHDFYTRNTPLISYLNTIASSPITQTYPNAVDSATISTFSCATFSFCNNFNDLSATSPGSLSGHWSGGIDLANMGSAQPLITHSTLGAVAMVYSGAGLKTGGGGKVAVSWESNAYCEPGYMNATAAAIIQNYYALLYGCDHFSVTKTFSPSKVCVGEPGSFQICAYNIGPTVLTAPVVYDSIPTCLSFQSSSPAPAAGGGAFYQWILPDIPVGVTSCVTVNFNTVQYPPCP